TTSHRGSAIRDSDGGNDIVDSRRAARGRRRRAGGVSPLILPVLGTSRIRGLTPPARRALSRPDDFTTFSLSCRARKRDASLSSYAVFLASRSLNAAPPGKTGPRGTNRIARNSASLRAACPARARLLISAGPK